MKVAMITSGYMPVPASLGGAVECLDDYLINENEKQGKCDITVFSAYDENAENIASTLKKTTVKFIRTPSIVKLGDLIIYHVVKILRSHSQTMSYRYILKRLHFIGKVSKDLSKFDYDRIMLENHATLLLIMKRRNNYKKYKGRYVYHLHNEQKNLYGCKIVLKYIKKIATVSGYISRCILEEVPSLEEKQVEVWRNCVDNTRFGSYLAKEKAVEMKKQYGIEDNEKVILFTGRLSQEKGIKELLQAFSLIDFTNVKLVIAGGYLSGDTKVKNSYEFELRNLADKIKDNIVFTGFVNYLDIPSMYEMADIVVIPSIWDDPAPLTVIETITSGVPLITTNSGGIVEYANKECAIILERDENLVINISAALDKLLNDDELRKKMSKSALELSEKWTIQEFYSRFLECVE